MSTVESWDAVVIGGGFYGLYLVEFLSTKFERVLLCEVEDAVMKRASYNNQARVHNGYHYPRSILTALRSRVNFARFSEEFKESIVNSFSMVYAIGRNFSRVSAEQFCLFMDTIEAPILPLPPDIRKLFDPTYIEDAFLVQEFAFDANRLRDTMLERIEKTEVTIRLKTEVLAVSPISGARVGLETTTRGTGESIEIESDLVFNCTYSRINKMLKDSGLPQIPLKHELTELCLVHVPPVLQEVGITVMCGPFFSCMPFPPTNSHSLSHVRYTPHFHWHEGDDETPRDSTEVLSVYEKKTAYRAMIQDARRYVPALRECSYTDSLWEIKTLLPKSEIDDSRPILFKKHVGVENFHVIMGSKIDNMYDMVEEVSRMLERN